MVEEEGRGFSECCNLTKSTPVSWVWAQTPTGAWYGMFVLGYKMGLTPNPAEPAPCCPPRDQQPPYPACCPLSQPALSLLAAWEQRASCPGRLLCSLNVEGQGHGPAVQDAAVLLLPCSAHRFNNGNSSGAPQPPCRPQAFLPASCGQGMMAQLGVGTRMPGPAAPCPHRQAGASGTAGVAWGQALRNVVFSIPVSIKVVNQGCKMLLFSPARCRLPCLPAPVSPAGARMRPSLLAPRARSGNRVHPGDLSCQGG